MEADGDTPNSKSKKGYTCFSNLASRFWRLEDVAPQIDVSVKIPNPDLVLPDAAPHSSVRLGARSEGVDAFHRWYTVAAALQQGVRAALERGVTHGLMPVLYSLALLGGRETSFNITPEPRAVNSGAGASEQTPDSEARRPSHTADDAATAGDAAPHPETAAPAIPAGGSGGSPTGTGARGSGSAGGTGQHGSVDGFGATMERGLKVKDCGGSMDVACSSFLPKLDEYYTSTIFENKHEIKNNEDWRKAVIQVYGGMLASAAENASRLGISNTVRGIVLDQNFMFVIGLTLSKETAAALHADFTGKLGEVSTATLKGELRPLFLGRHAGLLDPRAGSTPASLLAVEVLLASTLPHTRFYSASDWRAAGQASCNNFCAISPLQRGLFFFLWRLPTAQPHLQHGMTFLVKPQRFYGRPTSA